MFRTLSFLMLIVIYAACSKDESSTPSPSFKFSANGNNYQWEGDQIAKVFTTGAANDTCYYLTAHDSSFNSIGLRFNTNKIALGTYTLTRSITSTAYSPEHSFRLGNASWGSIQAGDFATVTITKIHDGFFVDGTFSARMACMAGSSCTAGIVISNGEFKNLPFFPF